MRVVMAAGILLGAGRAGADAQFVTLDRGSEGTRFGVETSLSSTEYATDPVSRTTVVRAELYGQYMVTPVLGGYGKLPVSYAYDQYDKDGDGEGSLRTHNAELGALFAHRVAPAFGVIAQVGLVLPTLNDDALIEERLRFDGSRAADALLSSASRVTALRFSVSPNVRRGSLFARADLGVDVVLAHKETEVGGPVDTVMPRGGVGVGYAIGRLAIGAEAALYDPGGDAMLATAAVSARFAAGAYHPYAALVVPIDDRYVDLAVTIGLEVAP